MFVVVVVVVEAAEPSADMLAICLLKATTAPAIALGFEIGHDSIGFDFLKYPYFVQ